MKQTKTRRNIAAASLLLVQACNGHAQDRSKAVVYRQTSSDGSVVKYGPQPADWAIRSAVANKIGSQAFILMDHGDFQNAEKLFRQAKQTDYPNGAAQQKIMLGFAELYAMQKRYPEAIDAFYRLPKGSETSEIGSDPLVNMEFALTLAEAKGDWWARAVEEYEFATARLIRSNPRYLKATTSLEASKRQAEPSVSPSRRQSKKAMSKEQMLQYLPQEWNVSFQRETPNYDLMKAMTHLFIGTHRHAFRDASSAQQLAHLRASIRYAPENPYAYYEVGIKLIAARRYHDARNAFVKAKQWAGSNSDLSQKAESGLQQANAGIKTAKQRL